MTATISRRHHSRAPLSCAACPCGLVASGRWARAPTRRAWSAACERRAPIQLMVATAGPPDRRPYWRPVAGGARGEEMPSRRC